MSYTKKFKKEKLFDWQVWVMIILFILAFGTTSVIKMNKDKCDNVNKTLAFFQMLLFIDKFSFYITRLVRKHL